MGRRRKLIDFNPEQVVVEFVRLGRSEDAVAELKRLFDKAPFLQRQLLRARLDQAVALFAEARERNDRLGIYRR
jgi:hypothetical protein